MNSWIRVSRTSKNHVFDRIIQTSYIIINDNEKIGLDDHMERVFKALAAVEMTISIIFCFLSIIADTFSRL